jgi:hypothetical protein
MNMRERQRQRTKWLPDGSPRYVRCYDDGGRTADRYTVVFTGPYRFKHTDGEFMSLAMSDRPFHPQGVGMHGFHTLQIDAPHGWACAIGRSCHLGKRIPYSQLPAECRQLVLHDYRDLWKLEVSHGKD